MSYSLNNNNHTFRLNCLYLLHQCLILAIYLHVTHLLKSYLLRSLIKELKLLWSLLANWTLQLSQLGLVYLPSPLDLLIETEFITHRYCSKHSFELYYRIYHYSFSAYFGSRGTEDELALTSGAGSSWISLISGKLGGIYSNYPSRSTPSSSWRDRSGDREFRLLWL